MKKLTHILITLLLLVGFTTPAYSAEPLSRCLQTGQETRYAKETVPSTVYADDDGHYGAGIPHDYTVLTTGDQSGTTNITINSKTHALSNNCVWDNRTGLMWARYVPTADIGPATDGMLFWQQWTLTAESCTFATVGDTITAAAGTPFNTDALCVGRIITISGTTNNNGDVTVTNITTSVITVSENLTDEGPVDTTFATKDDLVWDFVDQANANSLGGYTDWRLPNRRELENLVDLGSYNPSIDAATFPSTPSFYHWTASTHPGNSTYAWNVHFNNGFVYFYLNKRAGKYYVRLVRGGVL